MTEPEAEVDRLRRELADTEVAFWKEYGDLARPWRFSLGPIRIRYPASPMFIVQVFVVFHVLFFAVGAALIFTTGPTRELGIAMVVGAVFAFGSFVAQFWVVADARANAVYKEAVGDLETRNLKRLAARREEIASQIDHLERPDGSDSRPSA
jgi:hypothetical protein